MRLQEVDIQGDDRVNQWTEKQDNVDDKNSHSTNITKTETTAENVELKASKEILLCKKNTGNKICSIAKAKIQETETEEQRLFIHSSWLAVQSPYFRALFYSSGMKESLSKEIVLNVAEEELEAHYTLIKAMYQPSILDHMDPFTVLQVLTLANKYDVELIFKKCKYVLMSVTMSLELEESILEVIDEMLATDDLMEYLQQFLVNALKPLDKVWTADEFKNLSEVSLKLLLSSNELAVLSENTVFVALMSWCEHNDYNGPSLLSLLRPELMTVEFLHEVVDNHHLAKQMDGYNELLLKGFRYHSLSSKRKSMAEEKITKRVEYKSDDEPSFTWWFRISDDNLPNTAEIYESEHFWWCGFEIMLTVKVESNLFSVYLYVLNIEDASGLNFFWEVEAELFPVILRRQVTFRNHLDMGYDKMEFPFSHPIQRNISRCIKVFIHFAASSSSTPDGSTLRHNYGWI